MIGTANASSTTITSCWGVLIGVFFDVNLEHGDDAAVGADGIIA
jgi:hypothetical protein